MSRRDLTRRLHQLALWNVELYRLRRTEVNIVVLFVAVIEDCAASPVDAHGLFAFGRRLYTYTRCPRRLHGREDVGTQLWGW